MPHTWSGMSTPDPSATAVEPDYRALTAEYDARQRARAARSGRPTLRMAQPGHPISPATNSIPGKVTFFFLRDDELMCARAGKPPVKATGKSLDKAVTAAGWMAVAAEKRAATRMLTVARAAYDGAKTDAARDSGGLTLRLLQFARTTTVSTRFAVLTEALSRKFYAPAGADPSRLRHWAAALSTTISRDDPASGMAMLFEAAVGDESGIEYAKGSSPLKTIVESDSSAGAASKFAGPGCMATQYAAAESIDGAWDAMCRVDPLLRRRCEVAGEVVRISPVALEDGGYRCRIAGPARLREGECLVTDADGPGATIGQVRLQSFGVEGDDLHLIVGKSRRSTRAVAEKGMHMLFDAQLDRTDLLLSPAPFLRPAAQVYASRWSLSSGAKVTDTATATRNVPLYVALAGA